MIVKKHISQTGDLILAICDENLIGKTFEEGEKQLDLNSNFYKGETMSEEELLNLIPKSHSLNIAGPASIKFALKHKLIDKKNVMYVQDVPYTMCVFERKT